MGTNSKNAKILRSPHNRITIRESNTNYRGTQVSKLSAGGISRKVIVFLGRPFNKSFERVARLLWEREYLAGIRKALKSS